jgi:predicted transcriptional regulator
MSKKVGKRKVSDLEISRWMIKFDGRVSKVAKQLDLTTGTIRRRIANSPKIQARLEDASEAQIDEALDVLDDHLSASSLNAAKYVLDNKGRLQGYGAKAIEKENEEKVESISFAQLDTSKMDVTSKKLLLESLSTAKKKLEEEEG